MTRPGLGRFLVPFDDALNVNVLEGEQADAQLAPAPALEPAGLTAPVQSPRPPLYFQPPAVPVDVGPVVVLDAPTVAADVTPDTPAGGGMLDAGNPPSSTTAVLIVLGVVVVLFLLDT